MRASTPPPIPLHQPAAPPSQPRTLPEEPSVYRQLDPAKIPQHVAIIMDGNGRWAGKRALKRFLGHQQGAESVQFVVETASRINLPWLTLYAFSLENNLRRPKSEVSFLMKLLKNYLVGNVKRMNDNNVRMAYIGRTHELPQKSRTPCSGPCEATAKNTGTTLTLALNYGARSEIVDAARCILTDLTTEAHTRGCSVEDLLGAGALEARLDESTSPRPLHRAHARSRPRHPHLRRAAHLQLPPLADRLLRDLHHRPPLARLPRPSSARSHAAYQRRERRFGGLGETFTDEDLDTLQPAEEVAAEIKDHLIPKQEAKPEAKSDPVLTRR